MATDQVVEKQGTRGRGAMGAEVGEGAGSQRRVPSPSRHPGNAGGTGTAPTWRQVVSREKDGPGVLWTAWE